MRFTILYTSNRLDGYNSLIDLVLQIAVFNRLIQRILHLVLITGIGVNHIPVKLFFFRHRFLQPKSGPSVWIFAVPHAQRQEMMSFSSADRPQSISPTITVRSSTNTITTVD